MATGTLLVLGTFGAAYAAAREDWEQLIISIAVIAVAGASAFAGPRGVWLADGLGLFAVLIAAGAFQAWRLGAAGPDA